MRGSSWTRDLTDEDRETIATLQRRASSLDTMSGSRRGSTLSLASQQSVSGWAGIDIGQGETSEEQQNTSEEEHGPFLTDAIVWSGEHQCPVRVLIDTGTDVNIINSTVVARLDAPVNPLTTRVFDSYSGSLTSEGTVMLVLRFTDGPEYTEVRFHVLSNILFEVVLGRDWLKTTRTFLNARQGGGFQTGTI
jgi:hypothetical protein